MRRNIMQSSCLCFIIDQRALFYFWPMFCSNFYLGNIYTVVFLLITGVTEFLVLSVTYHCLVETVTYEWTKLQAWLVTSVLTLAGTLMFIFTSIWTRAILFIYGKGMATLTESVFLYLLYLLGRLVDTFHYGSPPTKLRILSLRLVPLYYSFKWYFMMQAVWAVLRQTELSILVTHSLWSWLLMLIPLILGILYIMYQYLITKRMTWQYMFRPKPKWGPRDFSERQLRKQYNSKYYIGSEVPRLLSRYLMLKRESKVYKIDVHYENIQKKAIESKAVGFGEDIKEKMM